MESLKSEIHQLVDAAEDKLVLEEVLQLLKEDLANTGSLEIRKDIEKEAQAALFSSAEGVPHAEFMQKLKAKFS